MLVISDGVLPLPFATMSTNADPAERRAWLGNQFAGFPRAGQLALRLEAAGVDLASVTEWC